jgi:outer membrane lipoprotein SlyB
MKIRPFTIAAIALSAVGFAGCSFPSAKPLVPAHQAGVMHTLDLGTVIAVHAVALEGQKTNLGTIGGAAVGGAATSPGRDRHAGKLVAQAAGAVVGAVAGQAVEEVATREDAQEITIRLDSGRTVMVTQESSQGLFREGDRVQVAHGAGSAMVRIAMN